MNSAMNVMRLSMTGFPIRKSPGRGLFGSYPRLIAAFHVLHRLLAPRHPPYALSSLTTYLTIDQHDQIRVSKYLTRYSALWSLATFHYSLVKEPRARAGRGQLYIPLHTTNVGGAERARTANLRLAKPALSQLSYGPNQRPDTSCQTPQNAPSPVSSI